jgi:hypothetical protein
MQIIAEGDALEVVLTLQQEGSYRGRYGHMVDNTKCLLNESLIWRVQHVKRKATIMAHRLAKLALLREEEQTWLTDFPDYKHDFFFFFLKKKSFSFHRTQERKLLQSQGKP